MARQELPTQDVLLRKPKKLWWRRLLWLFLGLILGITSVVGGVAIAGTMVESGAVLSMLGVNPEEYLTEEYRKKTITQIVMSLATGGTTFNDLEDIASITPFVETVLTTVNETLDEQFGFTFDRDELFAQPWADIGDYAINAVYDGIKLASVMNIDSTSEPLLQYIAFRKDEHGDYDYDQKRSIKDLQNEMNDLVHNAQIKDLTDVGSSGVLYNLRNLHVGTIATEIEDLYIKDLITIESGAPKAMVWVGDQKVGEVSTAFITATVGDLFDIDPENTFMVAIQDCVITNLADEIMDKTIGELTGNEENPDPPIRALKDYKISDLINGTLDLNDVALCDIVEIDPSNTILYALRNSTIGNLDDTAKNTIIGELFSEEELANNRILYALRDCTLATMQEGIRHCHIDDFVVDFDIDDPSFPKILKYLIVNQIEIEDLDSCIENMTIGDMINTSGNKILTALAPFTLNNIATGVGTLTLGDIIDITSSSPQILKTLEDVAFNDLASTINDLTIADIIPASQIAASPILTALSSSTMNTIGTDISNLTLGQALGITPDNIGSFSKVIVSLKDYKIDQLDTAVNNLALQDMIEITSSSPRILYSLRNATLATLSNFVSSLTFGDFFDYTSSDVQNNRFLSHIPSTALLTDLGTAISSLKFAEVYADEIFEDPTDTSTIKGTWKFLLCKKQAGVWNYIGADYTIADGVGPMMDNMKDNMVSATLFEIKDAGLMEGVTYEQLNKTVYGTTTKLGDYNIPSLINAIPVNP